MSPHERETKISTTAAEDEARAILQNLKREPSRATSLGEEVNQRYSAAPRKMIMAQLRECISRMQPPVSPQAIHEFLETQCEGVKDNSFEDHFRELLAVATEISGNEGTRIAADLTAKVVGSDKYPTVQLSRVPFAAAILTQVFAKFCTAAKPSRERLNGWTEVAQPLMSVAQSGPRFRAEEATQILDLIGGVDRKVLPDSLHACVPSLILLAGSKGAANFLTTGMGLLFAKSITGLTQGRTSNVDIRTASTVEPRTDLSPREQLSQLLDQASRLFDGLFEESERQITRLRDQNLEIESKVERAKMEVEERDRQLRIVRSEHSEELQLRNERIRGLERAEKDLVDSVERLRADLRLSDHNARQSIAEKKDEQRHRLGEMLDSALGSMRRDLEQALRKYPESEEIRNVGISFDSLQRKLLKEASNLDDTRLPRALLDPSNAK